MAGIDLSKLEPAPWTAINGHVCGQDRKTMELIDPVKAEFLVLARNAFDVMLRRSWVPRLFCDGGWGVQDIHGGWPRRLGGLPLELTKWKDPFTALVEADRWYRENIEKEEQGRE